MILKVIVCACCVCVFYSFSQYTIPNATQQPAWVFPIFFEDGNGDKDTVYFCYDPTADNLYPSADTIFGEKLIGKDTAAFWVGIGALLGGVNYDTTRQVYVNNMPIGSGLYFNKGKYPLKIKWDGSLFYSNTLPYPDLNPKPRTRITIYCSDYFNNCPWDYPITMTAYAPDTVPGNPFFKPIKDSVVFYGNDLYTIEETLGAFSMELKAYDAPDDAGTQSLNANIMTVFPNPVSDKITLTGFLEATQYKIYDYLGQEICAGSIPNSNEQIDVSLLQSGAFLLKILLQNDVYYLNFLKL